MRWLIVVLIAAAAGGVGWLLLGEGHHASEADQDLERDLSGTSRPSEAVSLSGAEGAGPRSLRATMGRCQVKARVSKSGVPAVARIDARFLSSIDAATYSQSWQRWQKEMFAPPAPPGPVAASATSDAEGNALLAGLAAGVYRLSARAADGAQAETNVWLPCDGASVPAVLELREGGMTLAGKITWADGNAATGLLMLTPPLSRGAANQGYSMSIGLSSTTLAPDGSFTLGGLAAGTHSVRLLVGDTMVVTCPAATLPASEPYVVVLQVATLKVVGRVLDGVGDAPIQGASATASSSMGPNTWASMRAFTDAEGRFELRVTRFPTWVSATAPGYGWGGRNAQVTGSEPVVLRLMRTGRIAGRVTAKDGSPAAGAVVCASGGTNQGNTRVSAAADKEGRYALEEVFAGEAIVVVRGGGWASPDLADIRNDGFNPFIVPLAPGASITVDLVAVPCGRLEGKTVDATGAPVAGASVSASAQNPQGFHWRLQNTLGAEQAASGAGGAFVLDNLIPGLMYPVQAQSPDHAPASAGPFLVSSEPSPPVEVRFPVARWADVRVLFEGEETPVPDARVSLVQVRGPNNWTGSMGGPWTTDREGRARAGPLGPSPEGDLGVQVAGDTIVSNRPPVTIEGSKEGPGPFTATVRVPRGRTIEGKVLKPDGTPASGAWVNAQMKDPPQSHVGNTTVNFDGTFTVKGVGAGAYTVNAGLQQPDPKVSWNGTAQAEGGATGVVIQLAEPPPVAKGEAIVVKVLDDRGELVRQAQVRLYSENSSNGSGTNEGTARFEFGKGNNDWITQGLAKGNLYLEVWAQRNAMDMPIAVGPARVGPLGADQRDVEVRLPPERTIEGRVVAGDGTGVRGVLVRARPSPDPAVKNSQSQSFGEGRTDAQGRFRVGSLGEGEHRLDVLVPPDFLVPDVPPAMAGARNVEVVLRRGTSARIRVRDPAGQPLAKASVNVQYQPPSNANQTPAQQAEWQRRWNLLSAQGRTNGGASGPDGVVVLRGLDPEIAYALWVGAPQEDIRGTSIAPWTPADTEVQLERAYVITGSVRDPQGRLVPGAQVMQKMAAGGWNGINTNGDGTFRLTGLARGMVTLVASAPGVHFNWNDPNAPSVTVAAGTENVNLVVEPGLELAVRVPNIADRGQHGQQVSGQVFVRRADKWEQRGWANDAEGRLVFKGLRSDETYAVWVQPTQGSDLFGWATDLRAGGAEVTMRMERGGTIRGRVTLPAGAGDTGVGASGEHGGWVQGTLDSDGRYEIRGLPANLTWKVYAWANVQNKHWNAQGDASVGGTLDLRLEEQPTR